MNELWKIVQHYLDDTGAREAALARKMGMSPQGLNQWKKPLKTLPARKYLEALADQTRTPYRVVLQAAIESSPYALDKSEPLTQKNQPTAVDASQDDYILAARKGETQERRADDLKATSKTTPRTKVLSSALDRIPTLSLSVGYLTLPTWPTTTHGDTSGTNTQTSPSNSLTAAVKPDAWAG